MTTKDAIPVLGNWTAGESGSPDRVLVYFVEKI